MTPPIKKILVLAALAGAGWYGYGFIAGKDKGPAHPPVPVNVATTARQDVPLIIRNIGNVIPYETVAIRSRIDSQVVEVNFHDGDMVKKDDVLFVLDDRTIKAQVNELQAVVDRDKAQLTNLSRQYNRSKTLTEQGYESKANSDDAQAAYLAQRAAVAASQASLDSAKVLLGYTRIVAPISGRTGTINVTVGNTVKANDTQPLVTLNQIQPIRVQSSLSQSYFDAVQQAMAEGGAAASITRKENDKITVGKLEYIDNAVDQTSGTFVTRAIFENEDSALWPGMFVTLEIAVGNEKQALVIPEVAVQHGQSGDYVFVIANGKAAKRDVTISRIEDNLALVSKGLKDDEQVVVDGMMSLKDGSDVTLPPTKEEKNKETEKP